MPKTRWAIVVAGLILACTMGWALLRYLQMAGEFDLPAGPLLVLDAQRYEAMARRHFFRHHPGEKPLNWRLAEKAVEFHHTQPMGKFILQQNDCSDFVDCITDDALGYTARFKRGSTEHVATHIRSLWRLFYWDQRAPLMPGDIISVRHSPWYDPSPDSCWHVGIIGSDGQVYDFVKLKSWRTARYGRNSLLWFVRNSRGPEQVIVWRLHPRYRYRLSPLPGVAGDERRQSR